MSTETNQSAVPPHPTLFRVGVVTISDRASAGVYEDRSGPAIVDVLSRWLATSWEPVVRVIADEQALIESTLCELADVQRCSLIVTTGGTGPAPRDVTPEATVAVCDRLLPGFGEQMRAVSVNTVPTAILSRQVAGTRGGSLIVNLPGKPAAIEQCLGAVWAALPYCIELIGGPRLQSSAQSPVPFRPLNA